MSINIDLALNRLYQRQITSREQLLNEMLRVKMTQKEIHDTALTGDKDQLFHLMKSTTEEELGFFPADRDDFLDIFEAIKGIDPVAFTLEIYKNDRMGTVVSPKYLSKYISEKISKLQPKKILVTEAEKHLSGLSDIISQSSAAELTLTTQLKPMFLLLKLAFGENKNVKIRFESIYSDCLQDEKYDYIYLLPTFGSKPNGPGNFLTRDGDSIALENMLRHLNEQGTLDTIVPAKITFAGGGNERLRSFITKHFQVQSLYILPEGTFKPSTAIKTYFLTVTAFAQPNTELGTMELTKGNLAATNKQTIPTKKFVSHEDWRVELLLSDDDEIIQRFRSSRIEKVKLKEVAEVFRGKSVLKKDTSPGNISVLNISNIENGEIDYFAMDTIDEDERKIKRYELASGDVVLSCRGTAIKSAVFEEQDKTVIASANLIIIRPTERIIGEYIKILFESPLGIAMIKSFQRGTIIMNINHSDIMEMEIPLLPIQEQQEIITQYKKEFSKYKDTISQTQNRWDKIKSDLYDKLL